MRERLLNRLSCPDDLSPLRLDISTQDTDGHVVHGQLKCRRCRRVYPIKQGVPELVSDLSPKVAGDDLHELKAKTVNRFGFEWRHFSDWGWLTEYPDVPNTKEKFYGGMIEHTRSAFWSKTLFKEKDLHPGVLVLDAGCGNGRFSGQAAKTGAEVIGVDLSRGVYSAFENTRSFPNVHIVRGDLFRLPFANETFDRIFSIGVLMHTGNAGAAFDSISRTLRQLGHQGVAWPLRPATGFG